MCVENHISYIWSKICIMSISQSQPFSTSWRWGISTEYEHFSKGLQSAHELIKYLPYCPLPPQATQEIWLNFEPNMWGFDVKSRAGGKLITWPVQVVGYLNFYLPPFPKGIVGKHLIGAWHP